MRLEVAMVARAAHSPCDASDSAPDRFLSTYASPQRRQRAVRAGRRMRDVANGGKCHTAIV
jgi:hypothetical protein